MKYLSFFLLILMAVVLMGARPMIQGFPVGTVTAVDRDAGTVSINLGENDGVLPGMTFLVVNDAGHEAASVTAGELYSDLFWSEKLPPRELNNISAGMQARWVLTPEIIALAQARKDDSGEAFKSFYRRFPKSRFMAALIREMPEEKLKKVSPVYYAAFKAFTKESFKEIIKNYPGTAFAQAASAEIKSIEDYDKEQAKVQAERAKHAVEAEAEAKRQEDIEAKITAQQNKAQEKEYLGKLRNNTGSPVRFVFKAPSNLPPTTVPGGGSMDVRSGPGSFEYEVDSAGDTSGQTGQTIQPSIAMQPGMATQPGQTMQPGIGGLAEQASGPAPLKTGTVDIQFDFWEADYP
ncbi:MAG: hypothetical protein WA666_10655 [Nitrospirota bacterium]